MRKDWYPTQGKKRAALLENLVPDIDKACGIRQVFASTHADFIASARAWPKTCAPALADALYKGRHQPAGGQGATPSVVAALAH